MIKKILVCLLTLCTLPILGMVFTVNYFLLIYYLFHDRLYQLEDIPLNEIGDFLAGVFGPIAFLWLVIGYLMQNKELKNSVENTAQALALSEQQLNFQESIKKYNSVLTHNKNQPLFSILPELNLNGDLSIKVINYGNTVFSFYVRLIKSKNNPKIKLYKESFEHKKSDHISILSREIEKHNNELKFEIDFIDGAYQEQKIELQIKNNPKDTPYPFSSYFKQSTKKLPQLPTLEE